MKTLIETNLNAILFVSVILGLFLPGIELIPNVIVTLLLALLMFFVSSKVDLTQAKDIPYKSVSLFYIARFILLPVILFYLADWLIPKYSIAILLLSLLPVGVTTPMLVAHSKGNVTFALALTTATSLLAPLMIPLILMSLHLSMEVEVKGLFITLVSIIIIPLFVYSVAIKLRKELKPLIVDNSSFVSTLMLGFIIAIVISKQKDVFLNDTSALFISVVLLLIVFLIFFVFGWFYPMKRNKKDYLICNTLSSGAINTALGINLALLYFSKDTQFFMVISEFVWVASIPLFNHFRKRYLE